MPIYCRKCGRLVSTGNCTGCGLIPVNCTCMRITVTIGGNPKNFEIGLLPEDWVEKKYKPGFEKPLTDQTKKDLINVLQEEKEVKINVRPHFKEPITEKEFAQIKAKKKS